MNLKIRARDEKGAVLVIVAISMITLLTLSVGGIMLFTLYGANREMQKAADQAAVAGAAALPLLRPGVALSSLNLNPVYRLSSIVGLDVPLKGLSNVPDPRAVACAYGSASLQTNSAHLITTFGGPPSPVPSTYCAATDIRVDPSLNSLSTPLSTCVNNLTTGINSTISSLTGGLNGLLANPLVNLLLSPLGLNAGSLTTNVNGIVSQLTGVLDSVKNLEALSPALLTPQMTVTVRSGVNPPLLSFLGGDSGVQMTVSATAERRLKNAIVLPNTPQLTNVSLNSALAATKPTIMNALGTANTQLNSLVNQLGIPGCQDLLSPSSKVVQDISDIYNPPASGGPAPTAKDILTGATAAAQHAAGEAGTTVQNLAGEAFLVINQGPSPGTISSVLGPVTSLLGLSGLVSSLQVPAMDVAIVAAHDLEDGNISNPDLIPDVASARGLFTATLVK